MKRLCFCQNKKKKLTVPAPGIQKLTSGRASRLYRPLNSTPAGMPPPPRPSMPTGAPRVSEESLGSLLLFGWAGKIATRPLSNVKPIGRPRLQQTGRFSYFWPIRSRPLSLQLVSFRLHSVSPPGSRLLASSVSRARVESPPGSSHRAHSTPLLRKAPPGIPPVLEPSLCFPLLDRRLAEIQLGN